MDAHLHMTDRALTRLHIEHTEAPGFRVGLSLVVLFVALTLTLLALFATTGPDLPAGVPQPAASVDAPSR